MKTGLPGILFTKTKEFRIIKRIIRFFSMLLILSFATFNGYSQAIITSSGSGYEINSSVSDVTAMSSSQVTYTLEISNTSSDTLSGVFQIDLPAEFRVSFSYSAPSGLSVAPVSGTSDSYIASLNLPAGATESIDYSVESCFLSDFGNNLSMPRTIVFSSSDPNVQILNNGTFTQTVNVFRGQSLTVSNPVTNDNMGVFYYEGTTFTRTYHIVSNGSNSIPFTGRIIFDDQLGTALDVTALQAVFPGSTTPVDLPGTYKTAQDHVNYILDLNSTFASGYLPSGLAVGSEIQIIETVKVTGCLDNAAGNSTINISWDKASGASCEWLERTLQPSVTRPTTPLRFLVELNSNYPNNATTCYSTTQNHNGLYTLTKHFENNRTDNVSLDHVEFNMFYSWADNDFLTKRPLDGVKLVRSNPNDASRALTIDFSSMVGKTDFVNDVIPFIQNYSSYAVKTPAEENYYDGVRVNILENYPNGSDDCSNSPNQIQRLLIDRYPDGNGGYSTFDFIPGDIYEFTWREEQCCRTYEVSLNHHGSNTRTSHAGVAMEYTLCNKYLAVNNMSSSNGDYSPHGYFNVFSVAHTILPSTSVMLNADPDGDLSTRDGAIGDVYVGNLFASGVSWMDGYSLKDVTGNEVAFVDFDILLEEGLDLDLEGISPNLSANTFVVDVLPKDGGSAMQGTWTPVQLFDKTSSLAATPQFLTSSDNSKIITPVPVNEYYTARFSLSDLADILGLPQNSPDRNLTYLLREMAEGEFHFRARAVSCPASAVSFLAVRSYLINSSQCNDCRNLLAAKSFGINLHCPGCHIPGPAVTTAFVGRSATSMGPKDNDNNGVPDTDQSAANPDNRKINIARLGDEINTNVTAVFSDGDAGGFTYSSLLQDRPEYILRYAYLKSTFQWKSGGIELQSVKATLTRTNTTITLLDVANNIFPAAGAIMMTGSSGTSDYSTATAVNGYKTSIYNTFYFRADVKDFDPNDNDGFNFGSLNSTDEIKFEITYRIVKDIQAEDNIVEVDHQVFCAKESDTYMGLNSTLDVGETCHSGTCVTPADLPADRAVFWCQGGAGIFSFIKYKADNSFFLQDPYTPNYRGEVDPCTKNLHIISEVYPQDTRGKVNFSAFPNEYRTVGHPSQFKVQLPDGYSVTNIQMVNTNFIDYVSNRGSSLDITQNTDISVPTTMATLDANNYVTIPVPAFADATSSSPGTFNNINPFSSMDELSYVELIIGLNANCTNSAVPDMVYWTEDGTSVPSGKPWLHAPEVTLPSLPMDGFLLPTGTTSQTDISFGNRYPRAYNTFVLVKPNTDIQVVPNGNTDVVINNNYFDIGIRMNNSTPKDANGNPIPSPYGGSGYLISVFAPHAYISLDKSQFPTGFHIDYMYEAQNPASGINAVTPPASAIFPLASGNSSDLVFDLKRINGNSEQDYRVVGHYDCSESGCDPLSVSLANCLQNNPILFNYGWNCSAPVPGSLSSCDVNQPLTYYFSNDKAKVNVIVPGTQSVTPCQTNTYQITLQSLETGNILEHDVTVTLPANAVYVAGSSTLNGQSFSNYTYSNSELAYTIPLPGGSNINSGSSNVLQFSYMLQCAAENPGSPAVDVQAVSSTYCNSKTTSNHTTPLSYAQAYLDDVTFNDLVCSPQNIAVTYSTGAATTQTNTITLTLPTGFTFVNGGGNTKAIPISESTAVTDKTITEPIAYTVGTGTYTVEADMALNTTYQCSPNAPVCSSGKIISKSCDITIVCPTPDAGPDVQRCQGDPATPIGTPAEPGFTYEWTSNPAGFTSSNAQENVSPATTTTYTLSVTGTGCTKTDEVTVTVNSVSVWLTSDKPTFYVPGCNTSVTLTANTSTSVTYQWYFMAKGTSSFTTLSGETAQTYMATAPGTYKVEVTDPVTGCTGSATVDFDDAITLSGSDKVCQGQEPDVVVSVGGAPLGDYKLQLIWDGDFIDTDQKEKARYHGILVFDISPSVACTLSTTDPLIVEIVPLPDPFTLTASGKTFICPTTGDQVTLTATPPSAYDPSTWTYAWSPSGPTPNGLTYTTGTSGSYVITALDNTTGCQSESNTIIVVAPEVKIRSDCRPDNSTLLTAEANVTGGTYRWTDANGTVLGTSQSIAITTDGAYTVELLGLGCSVNATIHVCATPSDGPNLVTNGDFASGARTCPLPFTSTPNIPTESCVTGDVPATQWPGSTMITSYTSDLNGSLWKDMTGFYKSADPSELNFLLADGTISPAPVEIWAQHNISIDACGTYEFRALFTNIIRIEAEVPEVWLAVNGVPITGHTSYPNNQPDWLELNGKWQANGASMATLQVMLNKGGWVGRDIGIDEIRFFKKGCTSDPGLRGIDINANVGINKYICPGSSVQIGANIVDPTYTYEWNTVPAGSSGAISSQANPTVSPSATTIYELKVTDQNGNIYTDQMTVYVVPTSFNIDAGTDQTICQGSSAQLQASGAGSYTWSPATGLSSTDISNPVASPTSTTTYTVTSPDALTGCNAIGKVTVTVNPIPSPPALTINDANGPVTEVCEGSSVTMVLTSADPGSTPLLVSSPSVEVLGGTGFPNGYAETIRALGSGDFTAYTVAAGCTSTVTTYHLTVDPNPPAATVSISPGTTICAGSQYSMSVSYPSGNSYGLAQNLPGATYINGGGGPNGFGASYTAGSESGDIIVRGISAASCTTDVHTPVTVNPFPAVPTITASGPTTFCDGDNVILSSSTGTGYTYQWSNNGTAIIGATMSDYTATTSGDYTVTVTNSGCSATSTATIVTVNTNPPAATVSISPGTIICAGSQYTIGVSYPLGNSYNIVQNLPGATYLGSGGGQGGFSVGFTAGSQSGDIIVRGSSSAGCTTDVVVPVTVNLVPATPTITASGSTTFCDGDNVVLSSSTGTGYSYQWNNNGTAITGATTSDYTATTSGGYTVMVTTGGCSATSTATTITVNTNPPAATVSISPGTTICAGSQYSISVSYPSGNSYGIAQNLPGATYINGGGGPNGFGASYTAGNESGDIIARGTSAAGCTTDVVVAVTVNTSCRDGATPTGLTAIQSDQFFIDLFPNPASEETSVLVRGVQSKYVKMTVYTVEGIMIYEDNEVPTETRYTFGKQFPSGVYVVKVTIQGQTQAIKLVITK